MLKEIRMLRPGFEQGMVALREFKVPIKDELKGIKKYLQITLKLGPNTINNRMAYANKYCHMLETWDLSEIMNFSDGKKSHIMKSLSLLSKYKGCYEKWQKIRNDYQLKWSSIDSLTGFHNILNRDRDFTKMIEWIDDTIRKYPRFSNIFMFNVLSGLNPQKLSNLLTYYFQINDLFIFQKIAKD